MSINEARMIRELKKNCTYRRLAEVFYDESMPSHGSELVGEALCMAALKVLHPGHDFWTKGAKGYESKEFIEINKSRIGDFYWWE